MTSTQYDVAIIGGGPSGSTAGTLLKKYNPNLRVLILEREKFPRDHIGESLLPIVSSVLNEMDCWDKVEGAGFPVKIGATYRWGSSDDLWDFDFLPGQTYDDSPRPAAYEGQRKNTAFQVDRAIYDKILLDHAGSYGVEVREETRVAEVLHEDGRIAGLKLTDGSIVTARYYIDASGSSGIVRRALGIEVQEPSALRNIAVWHYWQNADWAVNIGVSGTRIQVMSLGWGWIWFIPLGPTRTSIGLVMPAEYYKKSGKRPEELYFEAVHSEPRINMLLAHATCEEKLYTTKDWSFVSDKMVGENWFLVGEAAGFADPILSAGVTLASVGAWETAITIIELDRGAHDPVWLRSELERHQTRRVRTHILFADYWYTANAHFTELVEHISEIAEEAGLALDGKNAWQWLGSGGFVDTDMGGAGVGGFNLVATNWIVRDFTKTVPEWNISKNNSFSLNLEGAKETALAVFQPGEVHRVPAYERGGRTLPAIGVFAFLMETLTGTDRIDAIVQRINDVWCQIPGLPPDQFMTAIQALEAMVNDGWVRARFLPHLPLLNIDQLTQSPTFHKNIDNKTVAQTS